MSGSGINLNAPAIAALSEIASGVDAALQDQPQPAIAPQPVVSKPMTAGHMLRQAREAAGVHVAALAVSLKVPVRKLEALENDQLTAPSDAVFVRALAGSVCRSLKIDAAPVLALLPQSSRILLEGTDRAINRQFSDASSSGQSGLLSQVSKPMLWGTVALVLAAFVLVMLPDFKSRMDASGVMPPAPSPLSPPTAVAVAPPAAGGETVSGAPPAVAGASAASPLMIASTPVSSAAVAAVQRASGTAPSAFGSSLPASASGAVQNPQGGSSSVAGGPLVIQAVGEVWVDVTDAKGKNLLRKTLVAGEAVGLEGAMPLSVVVGRADSARVRVQGKPFDLTPHTRDNVARFEVKS